MNPWRSPTRDSRATASESAWRRSGETGGRPTRRRLFQVQNRRKPWRCQAMTVSGLTITSAVRQSLHERTNDAHSHRSALARRSRRGRDRFKT
jgi:hypothetical protein